MDAGEPRMSIDGGSPHVPTLDAGSDDAGVYVHPIDAGPELDASASDTPPTPVDAGQPPRPALDAGLLTQDAGSSMPAMDAAVGGMDASVDAGSPALDASLDASVPSRVCAAGKQYGGYCWFLGPTARSCNTACAAHGGYESSLEWIGTPAQGGSLEHCGALLTLLVGGAPETPTGGYREDGNGLGCHLYDKQRWWLIAPDFDPAAAYLKTRIVCSCFDR